MKREVRDDENIGMDFPGMGKKCGRDKKEIVLIYMTRKNCRMTKSEQK